MAKRIFIGVGACFYLAALCPAWELTPSLSYGVVFLDGAPNAYKENEPEPKTNEPLCAAVEADFGRFGLAASYAPRYEMYGEVGKVHDFEVLGRAAPIYRDRWAVYGEAGVGVSKSPVAMAFLFEEGPEYGWTAVVGAGFEWRPLEWADFDAGVTYRERLQVIDFFVYDPYYGTVKSPAVDIYAECLFAPLPFVAFGPSFRQILYGPYDYYLYSQTSRNKGWVTGKETYVLATVAFPINF
jgi:hypothetical protein